MAKKTINEQLERLETIAAELKNPDLGLEKSIKLYEEGMKLSRKCAEELDKAELIVKELSKDPSEEQKTASEDDQED